MMEELPEEFEKIKAKKDAIVKTLETAIECIRREKNVKDLRMTVNIDGEIVKFIA